MLKYIRSIECFEYFIRILFYQFSSYLLRFYCGSGTVDSLVNKINKNPYALLNVSTGRRQNKWNIDGYKCYGENTAGKRSWEPWLHCFPYLDSHGPVTGSWGAWERGVMILACAVAPGLWPWCYEPPRRLLQELGQSNGGWARRTAVVQGVQSLKLIWR